MKRFFTAVLALATGIALLSSCQKSDPLALALSADKVAVDFDGAAPQEVTVNLNADGDWYAYAPEWLTVTPSHGTGNTVVKITAQKNLDQWNELNAPRADVVAFCGAGETRYSINVAQQGEAGLDATKYYKKISAASEMDPEVTYLIVFDLKGDLQAAINIGCGKDDNTYAYGYTTKVTPDADGVIVMTNGSLSHKLEPVEGGYAIKQPNGAYIYQSSGYANFYLTNDISKASVWTVDFGANGAVTLTNTSAANRILQYDNKQYFDFGAWPDVTDGYVLPYLYMDQAEPTGEELFAAENTYVLASATSATIPVTANRTWKVRNHDSWVKDFTPSGANNGEIEISLEPNTTSTARTAEIQIIGETTNMVVNLVQAAPMKSVADLNAWCELTGTSADYDVELTNAVVSYVNGSNAFIDDGKAGILLYKSGHGLKVGDSFTGRITGKGTMYGGAPELTSWNDSEATKSTGEPVCVTVTLADLLKNFAPYVSRVVKVEDVKITDGLGMGDRNGKLSQGSQSIDLYAKVNNSVVITTNSEGNLTAIPCYNGTKKQLGVWASNQFEATKTGGAITVPATVEVENGETVALKATSNSGAEISYKSSDETVATVSADGVVTGLKVGEATITLTAPAVDGYTEAEATCTVNVVAPSPKVAITQEELPSKYGDDTEFTVNGITFLANQVACYEKGTDNKQGMQFKKEVGYIANKTAISGKITRIVITRQTSFYASNYVLTVGDAENPETVITGKSDSTSTTYDLSSGNYTFFKLQNTSGYAGYLDSIVIKYAE
ncbi:MAG: Ig-like domain-containing protein [Bacteroidales bacterium]|nr:Ig-like domain-containing protein [Bacteroidales bacterium]